MQLFKNKKHLNTREAEWIEGARRGDRRSQKAIYDLLSAKMFAVCLRYMVSGMPRRTSSKMDS